jgi:hypothetical protein
LHEGDVQAYRKTMLQQESVEKDVKEILITLFTNDDLVAMSHAQLVLSK